MECNIPFSLLEPHHCDLTGKTLSDSHTSSSPTPGAKRQRKEKSQKEKEKRVRRDTSNDEISSAVAAAAASTTATSSAVPSSSSSSAPTNNNTADAAAPVNGYTIKEETETADGILYTWEKQTSTHHPLSLHSRDARCTTCNNYNYNNNRTSGQTSDHGRFQRCARFDRPSK